MINWRNKFKQAVSNRLHSAFILATILSSCGQPDKELKTEIVKNKNGSVDSIITEGNTTTIFSNDVDRLGKIIDFGEFKPNHVNFNYFFHDNSGGNDRVSAPGPSDYSLEAYLEVDNLTNKRIRESGIFNEVSSEFGMENFNFNWLDSNKKELGTTVVTDILYHLPNGSVCFAQNGILLKASTN
jgi:hypothetical protein